MKSTATNFQHYQETDRVASEADPLLLSSPSTSYNSNSSTIRERRTSRTSSPNFNNNSDQQFFYKPDSSLAMGDVEASHSAEREGQNYQSRSYDQETEVRPSCYEASHESNDDVDHARSLRSLRSARSYQMSKGGSYRAFSERERNPGRTDRLHEYYIERAKSIFSEKNHRDEPLMDVNPQVLAIRKEALKVFEPLTYTWLLFSVGFSITAALSTARWTGLLPHINYWFLLFPCWSSHIGLLVCHIYSAKTLFRFINEANNNRQRSDSTDHIDRTEYLPLLQRALRFGLKTGAISSLLFIFEILLYLRLAHSSISLTAVFTPLWIFVGFGIIDGIVCRTQHITRVLSWVLALFFMVLLVLRVDYGYDEVMSPRTIIGPLVALLSIAIGTLSYVLYGHQIGYFRLSASQLNAGILYLVGLIGSAALMGMIITMHLARPNSFEVRVVMVAIAPLCVSLITLGAWAITKDEFEQLLHYGGQSSIQPMRLRLEKSGWTAVQGKGATVIPMFGEVRFEPLNPATKARIIELCMCCACYPYEDEDETIIHSSDYPIFADNMPGLRIPSSAVG